MGCKLGDVNVRVRGISLEIFIIEQSAFTWQISSLEKKKNTGWRSKRCRGRSKTGPLFFNGYWNTRVCSQVFGGFDSIV